MSAHDAAIDRFLRSVLGRRTLQRAGRRLYALGRGEHDGAIADNGEHYVQKCVLAASARSGSATVFDVGANVGEWTRLLMKSVPPGHQESLRLFVFEPTPATYEQLRSNLRPYDGRVDLSCFQLALSDKSGRSRFAVMSDTGGTNSLAYDATAAAALQFLDVETESLDGFCAARGVDHINLVKTDTEGHDLIVLRGGMELLQNERIDVYQFEYNALWIYTRAFLRDVFNLIGGLPYRFARLAPDHIELIDAWHPELERYFEANYVLVHERALPWFDTRAGYFDPSNAYVFR